MGTTPRGQVQTQGTTPLADTVSGAAGTVTGTERSKLQGILAGASRLATAALDGLLSAAHYALLAGATSVNTVNTLVKRDANGDIAVRYVNGALNGNATTATTATNANHATSADTATSATSASSATTATTAANATNATTAANATAFNNRNLIDCGIVTMGANSTNITAHGAGRQPIMTYAQFHTAAEHPSAYETHAAGHAINVPTGEVAITGSDTSNVYLSNRRSDTVYVHVYCIV